MVLALQHSTKHLLLMKKFLKITGISLLVILIALIAAPFLLKGKIIKMLKKETNEMLNAKVDFSNDIGVELFSNFPKLTVTIKEASVIGVDSFLNDTLAYLPELEVALDLKNILSDERANIQGIFLKDAYINLKVNKQGLANWDIVKPDTAALTNSDTASKLSFGLEKITIQNARFSYDDRTMPFSIAASNFDMNASGDLEADNFTLKGDLKTPALDMVYAGIPYFSSVNTAVDVVMDMDMKNMKFAFKDGNAKLNDLFLTAAGFVQLNEEDMDFDLKFATPQSDFKNVLSIIPAIYAKDFNKIKTSGKMAFDGFMKGKMTETTYPAFGFNLAIDNGFFKYPDLAESFSNIFLKLNIDNKDGLPDHTVIDLSKFSATAMGETLQAKLLVKTPVSDPYLNGMLKGKLNLADVGKFYPLEKGDEYKGVVEADVDFETYMSSVENGNYEKVKTQGIFNAKNLVVKNSSIPETLNLSEVAMTFNPKNVTVSKFDGTIGKSDFAINGSVDNIIPYVFANKTLDGTVNLKSNYFNTNPFMTDATVEEKAHPEAKDTVPMQVLDLPDNINFNFGADIKTLIYDNLEMNDLKGTIVLKEQKLFFENITTKLLGGSLAIKEGSYDASNPGNPFAGLDLKMENFDIIKSFAYLDMIKKLGPVAQYVNGLFSLDFKMGTSLNNDLSPKYPTFDGEGRIRISEAVVKGLSTLNKIGDILKIEKLKTLNIKDVDLRFKIKDGNFALLDSLVLPLYKNAKIKLTGTSSLDQKISYFARIDIPRQDFGTANDALNNLLSKTKAKGLNIDVSEIVPIDALISGTFTNPKVDIDLRSAKSSLVDNVKNQIKDEVNNRIDEGKDLAKAKLDAERERARQRAADSIASVKAKVKIKADQIIAEAEARAATIKAEARRSAAEVKAKVYTEADAQVAKVNGPIEKAIAKKAADKLKLEADKKEQEAIAEADRRADDIVNKAKEQANRLE